MKHIFILLFLIMIIILISSTVCKYVDYYSPNSKKVFLSFGGPTENYHNAVKRIVNEAKNLEIFDSIIPYTEKELKLDADFWDKNGQFLENNKRGYGYWLWKPYIIDKELKKLKDNDYLIYADAGCTINKNGKSRLLEYIDMLNNKDGLIAFQMTHNPEKKWTKNKALKAFNFENNKDILDSGQVIATVIIIKKNEHSVSLINEWLKNALDHSLINDDLSNESPDFVDHRHDQSLFSLTVKKNGAIILPDETYLDNQPEIYHPNYPFWATRNR